MRHIEINCCKYNAWLHHAAHRNVRIQWEYSKRLEAFFQDSKYTGQQAGGEENVTYGWTDVISGEPTDKEMSGSLPALPNIGISSVRRVTR